MPQRPPTAVFKCLDNERLDLYEAECNKLFEAYQESCNTKSAELGKSLVCRDSYDGVWITGYEEPDRDAVIQPGWRRDATSGFIVPHLRSKLGKQLAAELRSISYLPPSKPGLPKLIWGDGFMGPMNIRKIGADWFSYTTVPLGDREPNYTGLNEVDSTLWEPSKLSTYYVALESAGIDE